MVKCTCKAAGCDTRLLVLTFGTHTTLRLEQRVLKEDGTEDATLYKEAMLQLQATEVIELIRELRRSLINQANGHEDF